MIRLTNSKECTDTENHPDIYMSWNQMDWNIFGDVRVYYESRQLMCKVSDGVTRIYLTGRGMLDRDVSSH